MLMYRSIGGSELRFLLFSHNPVYGRRILSNVQECGCNNSEYGMVAFFKEPYKWHDSEHLFDIVVNINKDIEYGQGIYWASKNLAKTHIWTGRKGNVQYKIDECFVRYYQPQDIVEMNLGSTYTKDFIEKSVVPFCKKYAINLVYNELVTNKDGKPEVKEIRHNFN